MLHLIGLHPTRTHEVIFRLVNNRMLRRSSRQESRLATSTVTNEQTPIKIEDTASISSHSSGPVEVQMHQWLTIKNILNQQHRLVCQDAPTSLIAN